MITVSTLYILRCNRCLSRSADAEDVHVVAIDEIEGTVDAALRLEEGLPDAQFTIAAFQRLAECVGVLTESLNKTIVCIEPCGCTLWGPLVQPVSNTILVPPRLREFAYGEAHS
jgi:hypothetical protein